MGSSPHRVTNLLLGLAAASRVGRHATILRNYTVRRRSTVRG